MLDPVENSALAVPEAPPVFDFSDTIAGIMILFCELSWIDPMWGDNHGADADIPAHFDGWNHPVLLSWASERGYAPPLQYSLDGPGLYVLQRSLENKLAQLQREALANG